ncbi:MAG: FMN-binding glutamate synthase family protein [Actinomycetia bacterium]|nr:FMN-binding glutamate synthase family protein [Actinomycetes bacterium]
MSDGGGFLPALGGVLAGWLLAVALGILLGRAGLRRLETALGQDPSRSWAELLFSLQSTSVRELALTAQRAATGEPARHPMGSPHFVAPYLDQIGFDPATLAPPSLPRAVRPRLATILGPAAERPLRLDLPVFVAPMGYGVGLNAATKRALAEGAALAGTAVSSGEGPFFSEERAVAHRWILQLSRGPFNHQPETIRLADMVEIQVGQGSEAGTGVEKRRSTLPRRVRRALDDRPGPLRIRGGLPLPLPRWVRRVRRANPAVPLGVKIPASQHLEADLARLVALGVDVITLDGSEGGSASSPAVISDHFGLPAALATVRARRWLDAHGLGDRVSLVVSGGVRGAADIAKLMALGADAVAVGTVMLFAAAHGQVTRRGWSRGPAALVLAGPHAEPLDADEAAERVANWFAATAQELALLCQALGVRDLRAVGRRHLVAYTREAAQLFGLPFAGDPAPSVPDSVAALVRGYRRLNRVLARLGRAVAGPVKADREG